MYKLDLAGKKAIVTGGTRGLGLGMAEDLLEAGAEVLIIGSSNKAAEVAASLNKGGAKCHGLAIDLADAAAQGPSQF